MQSTSLTLVPGIGNNFSALLGSLLGKSMATNLGLAVHIMLLLIITSGMA